MNTLMVYYLKGCLPLTLSKCMTLWSLGISLDTSESNVHSFNIIES